MYENCSLLVDANIEWLRQAENLLERIPEIAFMTSPAGMAPHRVSSQMRHVLEFYECFLEGLWQGRIDYDSRKRSYILEKSRTASTEKIRLLIRNLEEARNLPADCFLSLRMEDSDADVWLVSSFARELQALASHTIHHFALIAMTLRLHGVSVDPDFGVSPSTLSYRKNKRALTTEVA